MRHAFGVFVTVFCEHARCKIRVRFFAVSVSVIADGKAVSVFVNVRVCIDVLVNVCVRERPPRTNVTCERECAEVRDDGARE